MVFNMTYLIFKKASNCFYDYIVKCIKLKLFYLGFDHNNSQLLRK